MVHKSRIFGHLFLVVALHSTACSRAKSAVNDALGGGGLNLTRKKESVEIGEKFVVTLNDEGRAKGVLWEARNEQNGALTACEGETSGVFSCVAEEPGRITIRVVATGADGQKETGAIPVDVLDPSRFDKQRPILNVAINSPSASVAGRAVAVSSLRAGNQGDAFAVQGETVTFDFTGSKDLGADATPDKDLIFTIDTGSGPKPVVNRIAQVTFPDVGAKLIKLRVTDAKGLTATKEFQLFVQCAGPNDVVVDPSKIVASPVVGQNNMFTFSAAGAVTGGSGEYLYSWDLNGDGALESPGHALPGQPAGNWWTQPEVPKFDPKHAGVYIQYEGLRKVELRALDKRCFYLGKATKEIDFVIDRADGIAGTKQGPQIPSHLFVQGEIRPKGFVDAAVDVNNIATHKMGDLSDPRRVKCSFGRGDANESGIRSGNFGVSGIWSYAKPNGVKEYAHGIDLQIDGIKDNIALGASGAADTTSAKVSSIKYQSDATSDVKIDSVFAGSKDSGCTTKLSVDITAGPGQPCGPNGEGSEGTYVAIIDGTYACPAIKDGTGREAVLTKGAFYCEVSVVDACVGGCCCCGGGVPPKPR